MSQRPSTYNLVLEKLSGQKDTALEDVVEMARQVRSTVESPGWAFIKDFLDQMIEGLDVEVERGLKQHVEYAALIAERRALRTVPAIADGIVEAGNRADKALHDMAARLAAGDST